MELSAGSLVRDQEHEIVVEADLIPAELDDGEINTVIELANISLQDKADQLFRH